jgi:carbamoyl-phosphate synthase large subunit
VACIGDDLSEAFYASWLATDQSVKGKSVFISLPDEQKHKVLEEARLLVERGWQIYATTGTHAYFKANKIKSKRLYKLSDNAEPSVESAIRNHKLDLIINVPSGLDGGKDGFPMRRLGIDYHIPMVTNAEIGRTLLKCLAEFYDQAPRPQSWQSYVAEN